MMRVVAALCLLLVAGLWPLSTVVSARGPEVDVEIVESGDLGTWGYSPAVLTVPVGTTVVWRNVGLQAHSVTSQDQLFDSRLLDSGKSWSYTFDAPGTYRYFCVPRPWMKGVVVVLPSDEPTPRATTPTPTPTQAVPVATPQPPTVVPTSPAPPAPLPVPPTTSFGVG